MKASEHFLEEGEGARLLSARGLLEEKQWLRLRRTFSGFRDVVYELPVQTKTVVVVLFLLFVGLRWRAGSTPSAPQLLAGLDEEKWAEATFGIFLASAIPRLEKANYDLTNFLNMLSQGQCDGWSDIFATDGHFSFDLPQLHGEFLTRSALHDAFCASGAHNLRAVRLVWNFPDVERHSGVALYEVFTQARPGAPVQKARWAQFGSLDTNGKIKEFKLYAEAGADKTGDPKQSIFDAAIQANLKRLNGQSCEGFEAALPATGTENWVLQSLPTGDGKKDEIDEKPRDKIMQKCRTDTSKDWRSIDFQLGSVEGVFPSMRNGEVIVFFHKEKRWKGIIDVADDPEALVVKLTSGSRPAVHSLYFYFIEGVHLSRLFSFKYGWQSREKR